MKHVFVETNFLINLARPIPDRNAGQLFEREDVIFHMPWCAVAEAQRTLKRIIDDDLGFDKSMLDFARRELLAQGNTSALKTIQDLAKAVRSARRLAKSEIDATIAALLPHIQMIAPSAKVIQTTLETWKVKSLPPFDEMILGAVLAQAEALYQAGERELYFCNLNKNDFSPFDRAEANVTQPRLEDAYARCGLTYVASFSLPA